MHIQCSGSHLDMLRACHATSKHNSLRTTQPMTISICAKASARDSPFRHADCASLSSTCLRTFEFSRVLFPFARGQRSRRRRREYLSLRPFPWRSPVVVVVASSHCDPKLGPTSHQLCVAAALHGCCRSVVDILPERCALASPHPSSCIRDP